MGSHISYNLIQCTLEMPFERECVVTNKQKPLVLKIEHNSLLELINRRQTVYCTKRTSDIYTEELAARPLKNGANERMK